MQIAFHNPDYEVVLCIVQRLGHWLMFKFLYVRSDYKKFRKIL